MTFRNYKINIPKYVRSRAKKKKHVTNISNVSKEDFFSQKCFANVSFYFFYFFYLSMVSKVQNCQVYADSLEPRGDKLIVFREKS